MPLKNYSLSLLERKFKAETNFRVRERIQMMLYLREGHTQREVSSILHVSVGIVPYWKERFEKEGFAGLKDKKGRGLKPKLNKKQLCKLTSAIDDCIVMSDGYKRGWKTKDARIYIQRQFNITYTARHCTRLLNQLNYRLNIPRPRHKRRNQQAVDEFKHGFKKNEKVWTKM